MLKTIKSVLATIALASFIPGIALANCGTQSDTDIEANKALVQGFYKALNAKDWEKIPSFLHKDFLFYTQIDKGQKGAEAFIASEKKSFDAFDGWAMPVVEIVAECNKVATYHVFEGTHARPVFGIAPSGIKLRLSMLMLLTIKDGKIIEKRAHIDMLDVKKQLESEKK